jgi:hypothetical protein
MINQKIIDIYNKTKNNQPLIISEVEAFVLDRIELIMDKPDKKIASALFNFVDAKLDFRKNAITPEFKEQSFALLKSGRIKSLAGFYEVVAIFEFVASSSLDSVYGKKLVEFALQIFENAYHKKPSNESESLFSIYQERFKNMKVLEKMNAPEDPNIVRDQVLSDRDLKEIREGLSQIKVGYMDLNNRMRREAKRDLMENFDLLSPATK